MAKRGPKPKIAGPVRPRKGARADPIAVPAHLAGVAREEYARVALRLRDAGTLAHLDSRLIEAYAEAHALRLQAWAALAEQGLTVSSDGGRAMTHPAFAIWREAVTRQKILSQALGLAGGSEGTGGRDGGPIGIGEGTWGDLLSFSG